MIIEYLCLLIQINPVMKHLISLMGQLNYLFGFLVGLAPGKKYTVAMNLFGNHELQSPFTWHMGQNHVFPCTS